MTSRPYHLGIKGEQAAAEYLKKKGYKIIAQNYKSRWGEIDVIAHDGAALCFIEVRTRLTDSQGHPFETVTNYKKRRIIRTALYYLQEKGLSDDEVRFDVVAVIPSEDDADTDFTIEIIQNAFDADMG